MGADDIVIWAYTNKSTTPVMVAVCRRFPWYDNMPTNVPVHSGRRDVTRDDWWRVAPQPMTFSCSVAIRACDGGGALCLFPSLSTAPTPLPRNPSRPTATHPFRLLPTTFCPPMPVFVGDGRSSTRISILSAWRARIATKPSFVMMTYLQPFLPARRQQAHHTYYLRAAACPCYATSTVVFTAQRNRGWDIFND